MKKTFLLKQLATYGGVLAVTGATIGGIAYVSRNKNHKNVILKGEDLSKKNYVRSDEFTYTNDPANKGRVLEFDATTPLYKNLKIDNNFIPASHAKLYSVNGTKVIIANPHEHYDIADILGKKQKDMNSEIINLLSKQVGSYSMGKSILFRLVTRLSPFYPDLETSGALEVGNQFSKINFVSTTRLLKQAMMYFALQNKTFSSSNLSNKQKLANEMFLNFPYGFIASNSFSEWLSKNGNIFSGWLSRKITLNNKDISFGDYLYEVIKQDVVLEIMVKLFKNNFLTNFDYPRKFNEKESNEITNQMKEIYKDKIDVDSTLLKSFSIPNKNIENAIEHLTTNKDGFSFRHMDKINQSKDFFVTNNALSFDENGVLKRKNNNRFLATSTNYINRPKINFSWRQLFDRIFIKQNIDFTDKVKPVIYELNTADSTITSEDQNSLFRTAIEKIKNTSDQKEKTKLSNSFFDGPNESEQESLYDFDNNNYIKGEISIPFSVFAVAIKNIFNSPNKTLTQTVKDKNINEVLELTQKSFTPLVFNSNKQFDQSTKTFTLYSRENITAILDKIYNLILENNKLKDSLFGVSKTNISSVFRKAIFEFNEQNIFTNKTKNYLTKAPEYNYQIDGNGDIKIENNLPVAGTDKLSKPFSALNNWNPEILLSWMLLVGTFNVSKEKLQYSQTLELGMNYLMESGMKIFENDNPNNKFSGDFVNSVKSILDFYSNKDTQVTNGIRIKKKFTDSTTVVGYRLTGNISHEISSIKINNKKIGIHRVQRNIFTKETLNNDSNTKDNSFEYVTDVFNIGYYDNSIINIENQKFKKIEIEFFNNNKKISLTKPSFMKQMNNSNEGLMPAAIAPFLIIWENNTPYITMFKNKKGA